MHYLDPYTLWLGNPALQPAYTSTFAVTQTWKQRYNLALEYAHTKGFVGEVPVPLENSNITVFQQQNLDDMQRYSVRLNVPVMLSSNWEMNNNASMDYQKFSEERAGQLLNIAQLTFMAQSNHNVMLPEGIKLEVNVAYRGPAVYGFYRLDANWGIDAGLKRSFMHDQLDLSLSFTDILKTKLMNGGAELPDFSFIANQYNSSRSVRLAIHYRFNKGVKVEAGTIPKQGLDEVGRTDRK